MLGSDRERIRLEPLTIVFATSKANIDIVFPFAALLDTKPLLEFKLVMLLPSVSRTSTAFSSPTVLALPKIELTSETCFSKEKEMNMNERDAYLTISTIYTAFNLDFEV